MTSFYRMGSPFGNFSFTVFPLPHMPTTGEINILKSGLMTRERYKAAEHSLIGRMQGILERESEGQKKTKKDKKGQKSNNNFLHVENTRDLSTTTTSEDKKGQFIG